MINLNDNKNIHIEGICWICQECEKEYTFIKDTPCEKCIELKKRKNKSDKS